MIKRMEIWTGAEFAFLIPSVWAEKLDSSIKTKTNTNPQVWKPGRLETSRDEKSVVKSVPTPAPPRGTRSWEGTQRLLASVRASRWLVWIFGDWTLTGKTNLVVLVVTEQTRKKMSGLNLTIVQDLWPNQPETGNRFNKAKLPFLWTTPKSSRNKSSYQWVWVHRFPERESAYYCLHFIRGGT